jgi:hypothetical protein
MCLNRRFIADIKIISSKPPPSCLIYVSISIYRSLSIGYFYSGNYFWRSFWENPTLDIYTVMDGRGVKDYQIYVGIIYKNAG